MPNQKYQTEFTFNTYVDNVALFRPSDIYKLGSEDLKNLSNFHIYFVCKRPKITLQSENIRTKDNSVYLDCLLHLRGFKKPIMLEYKREYFPKEMSKIKASPYPHDSIIIENSAGDEAKVSLSLFLCSTCQKIKDLDISEIINMEVVYIGQSFSKNENRTILDRLSKHETIQKILASLSVQEPDSELFLFLFRYAQAQYILKVDGSEIPQVDDEVDSAHIERVINHSFSDSQQTSITEAGLIRYFQPEFNKIYKESFPSTNLEILRSCYQLDLCSVAVTVAAAEFGVNFFSAKVKPSLYHVANFDLHSPKLRKGFFAIT